MTTTYTESYEVNEIEFNPINVGRFPLWKAIYWNLDAGVSHMQVRVGVNTTILNSNDWIGPTGTGGSLYNVWGSGLHRHSAGSGRLFQAKAWLTGTGTAAPILTILYE